MPIRPILDKIAVLPLIQPNPSIVTIVSHTEPLQGIVKGIGSLVKTVKLGDVVHYKGTSGHSIRNDGTTYRVIKESEILAIDPAH